MKTRLIALLLLAACQEAPATRISARVTHPDAAEPSADVRTEEAAPDASVPVHPDASVPVADAAALCGEPGASCMESACCAGSYCETNQYLAQWRTCVPALDDGEPCDDDRVCVSGHCRPDTFVCGQPTCGAEGHSCFGLDFACCPGLACDVPADSYGPGACAPLQAIGAACAGDAQCESGRCAVGRCAEATPAGEATFARVFEEVLVRNGCTNGYCHGTGAGGLVLSNADDAYRALVGVSAQTCVGTERVVAADAEASLLWRKIAPGVVACGSKMPPAVGAVSPAAAELVRAWIAAGALR